MEGQQATDTLLVLCHLGLQQMLQHSYTTHATHTFDKPQLMRRAFGSSSNLCLAPHTLQAT